MTKTAATLRDVGALNPGFFIPVCVVLWHDPKLSKPTVDGRNPAPVDRWFIPLFKGF